MYSGKRSEFKVFVVLALVIVLFGFSALKEGGITGMVVGANQLDIVADLTILAIPNITFSDPTDTDNVIVNRTYTFINVSVGDADTDNLTAFINWDNSLVGWWRLNENASTTAEDFSGYGNNGTLTGFDWTADSNWTTGKFGSALVFDAVNDIIDLGSNASLRPIDALTVMAWVKSETTGNQEIVSYRKNSGPSTYGLYMVRDDIVAINVDDGTADGSDISRSYLGGALDSSWHHVALTFSRANQELKAYKDGVVQGAAASTGGDYPLNVDNADLDKLYFGAARSGLRHFNGSIDEIQIYNRSLSAEEINASYNATAYQLFHNFTDLTDKNYSYTAYVQDENGNVNQTETRSITIDTQAPIITITSPLSVNYTSVPTLTVNFDHAVNKSWYSVNDGPNTTLCDGCSSANSVINHEYENTTNISAWWHFNNNSGNTTLDESNNGNIGDCYNMAVNNTTCTWVEGKFGSGIDFDGVDDCIYAGNDASLRPNDSITVSAWIKNKDTANSELINYRKNTGPSYYALYAIKDDYVMITLDNGSATGQEYGVWFTALSNDWHFVVLTYSRADQQLNAYIDGVLTGTPVSTGDYPLYSASPDLDQLYIGCARSNLRNANVTIDEVRILNKSLTAAEVLEEYELSKGDHNITLYANSTFSLLNSTVKSFTILNTDNCTNLTGDTYGGWNLSSDLICSDIEIIRHGDTLVHNGGNLTMQNVTFRILSNNHTREVYSLQSEGGNILINNSEITSWNNNSNAPASTIDDIRAYISIDGSNINITNSNISYLGNSSDLPGLYLQNVDDSLIYNNTFSYNYVGIRLDNAGRSNITSNEQIINNDYDGILLFNSNHTNIEENNFSIASYYGIEVRAGFNTTITNNNFSEHNWAHILTVTFTDRVLFTDNTFGTTDRGILARSGNNIFIENNTFTNCTYNTDSYDAGVWIRHTINLTVINNNFTQMGSFGIHIENTTNAAVLDNYIDIYPLSEKGSDARVDDINVPPIGISVTPLWKAWCPIVGGDCDYDYVHSWISHNITIENNTFGPNVQVLLRDIGTENLTHDLSSEDYWYVAMQLPNWTDKDEMFISTNYSNLTNWLDIARAELTAGENNILWENFYGGSTQNAKFQKIITRTKLNFSNQLYPEPFRLYSPKWLLFNGSETELIIYQNYTYKLFDNDSIWYATVETIITPHNDSEINLTVNQYNSTIINITAVNTTADQTMDITVENGTFDVTNGAWYRITKDGTQIATAQANSNNNITFNNVAVGSEYIIESTSAPSTTESPGGGGSSSISLICAPNTIKCINSLHYQECLQYGTTNKWSVIKDTPEGFQCQFGKIVEIEKEEVTKAVEETEETQPALPMTEEIAKETKPQTSFYKTIKNLTWLWLTLIIITIILSIAYFWMRKN